MHARDDGQRELRLHLGALAVLEWAPERERWDEGSNLLAADLVGRLLDPLVRRLGHEIVLLLAQLVRPRLVLAGLVDRPAERGDGRALGDVVANERVDRERMGAVVDETRLAADLEVARIEPAEVVGQEDARRQQRAICVIRDEARGDAHASTNDTSPPLLADLMIAPESK